jgi:hypothetical protein
MTNEQFESMVKRHEGEAKHNPSLYKFKVLLLAMLGYGYIVFILSIGFIAVGLLVHHLFYGSGGNALSLKVIAVLGALIFLIFRSLWFRTEKPEGIELIAQHAPSLFEDIEDIRAKLKGPKIHHVLLTDDFNAAIVQHPRFGFFGFHENYLLIGLPLLQALPVDQARFVVAHEMGHLAGAHGRFGNFIYRLRISWYRLLENLELEESWSTFIFKLFFKKYIPYFYAYTFVFARQQEYEADASAAQLVGQEVAAASLISLDVKGQQLSEDYWANVYKNVETSPAPPKDVFKLMEKVLETPAAPAKVQSWLQNALHRETDIDDTHPSLSDRLHALGINPNEVPLPHAKPASSYYLGDSSEFADILSQRWYDSEAENWDIGYQHAQDSRNKLKELHAKPTAGLSFDDAFTKAVLTEQYQDSSSALGVYKEINELFEANSMVLFAIGRILLEQKNEEGIPWLEQAMQLDEHLIMDGSAMIYDYLVEDGKHQQASAYYDRIQNRQQFLEQAEEERSYIGADSVFLPHGLDDQELSHIQQQLQHFHEIKEAYLVQKEVRHFPEKPVFVLGYRVRRPWYTMSTERFDNLFLRKLAAELDTNFDTYMVQMSWENFRVSKEIKKVDKAKIV